MLVDLTPKGESYLRRVRGRGFFDTSKIQFANITFLGEISNSGTLDTKELVLKRNRDFSGIDWDRTSRRLLKARYIRAVG